MQNTIRYIKTQLAGLYSESETDSLIRLIVESVCGWNFTTQHLKKSEIIGLAQFENITKIIERLEQFEPIQYILGETLFFGLPLKVTPAVLIPRPETEELVDLVVRENANSNCSILDIGTGSGCIALALKSQLKNATITGVDISWKALEVARNNGEINGLDVRFIQADILKWELHKWPVYFDIIVSNPPYITETEKTLMHKNVLDFEPPGALFVPNTNPLLFYRHIALFAFEKLSANGTLYFEINEKFGSETEKLLADFDFRSIKVIADIHGKNRFVRATKP